ncbi:hypothetical protein SAMN05660461_4327 [Chitinophaga ginsengisegetis]|uniref:Uncharacterized protein n=1 Tax=Chitinophaga ginsengisegetis TaxID=393003 RepID=A0A1T5P6P4_9BACT|nr:hypothetical protein SAMN05660461_4327 [Chitinophaga ginsengisegetis]
MILVNINLCRGKFEIIAPDDFKGSSSVSSEGVVPMAFDFIDRLKDTINAYFDIPTSFDIEFVDTYSYLRKRSKA